MQKFIGVFILSIMLMNNNVESSITIPFWMILYCSILISLGIIIGGKTVIKTVGMRLSNLELYQGVVTDISASLCILVATIFGLPISTSHTKSMSIVGVSASRRLKNINWNVIRSILLAGVITFPCCGLFAFIITKIILLIGGIV